METRINIAELTDLGNSDRFIHDHGDDVRFCARLSSWYTWKGTVWEEDIGEMGVFTRGKKTVRSIRGEAELNQDLKREILKHAIKSESLGKISAMIKLSRSVPEIQIRIDQMDADSWLLNCPNGTVDLKTGELRPHERSHFLTRSTSIPYDTSADAPLFLNFLNDIMQGNQGMIDFLQRMLGYALTGSGQEQVLFFLYGNGANGKTTLIETMRNVFGEFAMHTPTATLIKNSLQIRNDIARLKGARLVTASEVSKGKELDEATTKMLTGEDPVTSRFLYKELFEYRPNFKIFLLANHLPEVSGSDFGIWRRIILIPFPAKFDGENRDMNLQEKLKAEGQGILSWLVQGAIKWQQLGLQIPKEVRVATEQYRGESDIIPQFLSDVCIKDTEAKVSSKSLFEAYTAWAEKNCDTLLKQKALGILLKTAGFKSSKSDAIRYWSGLRLKPKAAAVTDKDLGQTTAMAADAIPAPTEVQKQIH